MEEEFLLGLCHALLGSHWSQMVRRLPGRCENSIKNFWNATLRSKPASKKRGLLWAYMQVGGVVEVRQGRRAQRWLGGGEGTGREGQHSWRCLEAVTGVCPRVSGGMIPGGLQSGRWLLMMQHKHCTARQPGLLHADVRARACRWWGVGGVAV